MGLDRRERSGELVEAIMSAQEGHQARIWTAMPGIVQSWNADEKTAVVQPAIQALVEYEDGSVQWVTLPLLVDCPIVFPGGGDVVLTFPLKQGDECLVVFASRCIDSWWQSGGIQVQAEMRMHDLSDGFCIPGVSSRPRVEAAISTSAATLRSRDGTVLVSLDPAGREIHVTAPGADVDVKPDDIKLTVAPTTFELTPAGLVASCGGTAGISMSADALALTGNSVVIAGKEFLTHHHSGVQTGGGNTGNVV